MAWIDDFSVDFSTGEIRHVNGATRYPVIDMHRALMSLTAQAVASGDDLGDITDLFVPSKRASDTDITLNPPMNIDDNAAEFMFGGSTIQNNADDKYSGLDIGGVYNAAALPQVVQNNIKLTNYWGASLDPQPALGVAVRLLIRSRTAGVDIDGGRIRVQSRGYPHIFRETTTVLGSNVASVSLGSITVDSFLTVNSATIATYNDIVNTEGFQLVDYADGAGGAPYYMQWTKGSRSKADVYNRVKYETRDGSAETLYGLTGELFRGITHIIDIDNVTGMLVESGPVTWATGTGQLLAVDTTNNPNQVYIQLLTGVEPQDNDQLTAGGTADVVGNVVSATATGESVAGNFTGSWVGAFGAAQAVADISNTDSFTDLRLISHAPPNFQSVSIGGLVVSEDRLILGKSIDGGASINKSEYASAVNNDLGNNTIEVTAAITNVPEAGYVRISNGLSEDRYPYSSFSGTTFNLDGVTLTQNYGGAVDVYPTILDLVATATTESQAWIYTADVDLAGQVVDDGSVNNTPTIPFPLSVTFNSTGAAVNIVRTPDA